MAYGNAAVASGVGINVAVDTVAGSAIQRVKLVGAAEGDANPAGTQTNPIFMNTGSRRGIQTLVNKTVTGTTVTNLFDTRTTECKSRQFRVESGGIWVTADGTTTPVAGSAGVNGTGQYYGPGEGFLYDAQTGVPWEAIQAINDTSVGTGNSIVKAQEIV